MIIYRLVALIMWFGVMFAVCTIVIAVGLAAVIGAATFGFASPSRTPKSTLQALAANTREGIARVKTLQRG